MEAPATAGAHRHRGGLNLPLEVAKETASGGGTHFALFYLMIIDWEGDFGMTEEVRGGWSEEFLLVLLAHLIFLTYLVCDDTPSRSNPP